MFMGRPSRMRAAPFLGGGLGDVGGHLVHGFFGDLGQGGGQQLALVTDGKAGAGFAVIHSQNFHGQRLLLLCFMLRPGISRDETWF